MVKCIQVSPISVTFGKRAGRQGEDVKEGTSRRMTGRYDTGNS